MKRITKIRKKLKDKKYLQRKLDYFIAESERLEWFKSFECSIFFVGYHAAMINQRKYERAVKINDRHLVFIDNLLNLK